MTERTPASDNFWLLLDAACDGSLDETQIDELAMFLDSDAESLRVFADHVQLRTDIGLLCLAERSSEGGLACVRLTFPQESLPLINLLGSRDNGPVGHSFQAWSLAYLTATVLVGVAALIGSLIHVSRPEQFARDSLPSASPSPGVKVQVVGRITGLADCQWADPKTDVAEGDDVPLGQQYTLTSGFVEIAYQSGAKVILQGPCRYAVESKTGGYLSLGKLTALVTKKGTGPIGAKHPAGRSGQLDLSPFSDSGSKGERTANLTLSQPEREATTSLALRPSAGDSQGTVPIFVSAKMGLSPSVRSGEESASQKSDSPLSPYSSLPLFSVRTPTAVVDDLGTEFGVEVDQSGATRSHVYRGKVEMQPLVGSQTNGRPIQLVANQWARVEARRNGGGPVIGGDDPDDGAQFVREMPYRNTAVVAGLTSSGQHQEALPEARATLRGADGASRESYHITDLGTLGGPDSRANAINAAGQVVGEAMDAGGVARAFLYTNGRMEKLSPPSGGPSTAVAINSAGQVAGSYDGNHRAFLYSGGVMKDLGTLGGPTASAAAINDAGQVVGASEDCHGVTRAFINSAGEGMKDLGALGGAKARSWGQGINADGLVVGYSETDAGDTHAFVYSRDQGMRGIVATSGRHNSWAFRVNAAGQVVGCFDTGDDLTHIFVYSLSQGIKELNPIRHFGFAVDIVLDINNKGDVAGQASWGTGSDTGRQRYLFTSKGFFTPDPLRRGMAGWTRVGATGINDSGQIVGVGISPQGKSHAILVTVNH